MTNEQYYELIKPYEDASRMLLGRLELLNRNLYASRLEYRPIHNIQSRIKEKKSIEDKLHRLGHRDGVLNARDYLQDIAGIRMICYFVDDIYNMVAVLKKQSDLVIMKEKDYIAFPKPNGYRSYHIVVGMPVYCLDTMEYFPVEVQFRTMSMDFWANMEHRICYKKSPEHREILEQEFRKYAGVLQEIEEQFEKYSDVSRKR
ncbi:MAG: (p)ppGpp synthetase [Lachnospiraceae bacterium]|nr:(p)ppGpp synthetase [Lachnospiraceae bacterium]